jgi:hypothetical protein
MTKAKHDQTPPPTAPTAEPSADQAMPHGAPASGLFDPAFMMAPYLEFARILARTQHNAEAMVDANRALADSLRTIMRRQQDLALELADAAFRVAPKVPGEKSEDGEPANDREIVFDRAINAVREIGEAVIGAQLSALQRLKLKNGPEHPQA